MHISLCPFFFLPTRHLPLSLTHCIIQILYQSFIHSPHPLSLSQRKKKTYEDKIQEINASSCTSSSLSV
ncbi:hypothetical protein LguiA_017314 [Lonicera macranthoides]